MYEREEEWEEWTDGRKEGWVKRKKNWNDGWMDN